MSDGHGDELTAEKALATSRILWAAMLASQAVILVLFVVMAGRQPDDPEAGTLLLGIAWGMLVVCVPLGYWLRGQIYKKNWEGNRIKPQGYMAGNVMLWAFCEGVGMFGSVSVLISGAVWPHVLPAVLAATIHIVNYPNGRAMQPEDPAFGHLQKK